MALISLPLIITLVIFAARPARAQVATRALVRDVLQNNPLPTSHALPSAPVASAAPSFTQAPAVPFLPRPVPPVRPSKLSPIPAFSSTADTWEILESTILSLDYQDEPLKDVFDDLRQTLKINLVVYWPSLAVLDIEPEQTVTLKLDRVTAAKALDALLALLSDGKSVSLDFTIDQEVLEINRKDLLPPLPTVKVYYIGDLNQSPLQILNSRFLSP